MTARTGGLTASCPRCNGPLTLWSADAPHGFSYPVSNCEDCLIIIDTGY